MKPFIPIYYTGTRWAVVSRDYFASVPEAEAFVKAKVHVPKYWRVIHEYWLSELYDEEPPNGYTPES